MKPFRFYCDCNSCLSRSVFIEVQCKILNGAKKQAERKGWMTTNNFSFAPDHWVKKKKVRK